MPRAKWPRSEHLDSDDRGPIPAVNVSVKISALFSQIKAEAPNDSIEQLCERLRPLLRLAKARSVFINFDMEMHSLKGLTLRLFKALLDEEEFNDYPHAGIAMQAYLRDTPDDVEQLIEWAAKRRTRVTVRLVKGAYWDTETILARQRRWPVPVYEHKQETDAAYERLARRLLENSEVIDCAFGTHNVRTIAACLAEAEADRSAASAARVSGPLRNGGADQGGLKGMGYRVREYCPLGQTLPGMAYLVRRLLENTSNEGFLRAKFSENTAPRTLLRNPETVPPSVRAEPDTGFKNEPHADFSRADLRDQMTNALRNVRAGLSGLHPLLIGESEVRSGTEIISRNPARPDEVVGRVEAAGRGEVDLAVTKAAEAFESWRDVRVEARARILERAAALLSQRRFDLAALEVFETGKTWREADADVCEAIDFCRYYAGEMRRLACANLHVPGEEICHGYIARGVAAVIAPWNFPLAILCGMTTAALAAGNAVIMKPSGQSAAIAAVFGRILREAGVPPGAINCLPGSGSEIGSALVEHPGVAIIAFTGSREVGTWDLGSGADGLARDRQQLKKVVCEMGGKNAVIVDDDADLDEAVRGSCPQPSATRGRNAPPARGAHRASASSDRLTGVSSRRRRACRWAPADPAVMGPIIDERGRRGRLSIEARTTGGTLASEAAVTEGRMVRRPMRFRGMFRPHHGCPRGNLRPGAGGHRGR